MHERRVRSHGAPPSRRARSRRRGRADHSPRSSSSASGRLPCHAALRRPVVGETDAVVRVDERQERAAVDLPQTDARAIAGDLDDLPPRATVSRSVSSSRAIPSGSRSMPNASRASTTALCAASQPCKSVEGSASANPAACAARTASSNEEPPAIRPSTKLHVPLSTPSIRVSERPYRRTVSSTGITPPTDALQRTRPCEIGTARDHGLVRRDHRASTLERRVDDSGRGIEPAEELDHDVRLAIDETEHVGLEELGAGRSGGAPDGARRRRRPAKRSGHARSASYTPPPTVP